MLVPVARVGDKSDHNGEIITGSPTWMDGGLPVARVGDIHRCPIHGDTPIMTGSYSDLEEGQAIAHVGSKVGCGAIIITGNPTFLIEPTGGATKVNQPDDEYDVRVNIKDDMGELVRNRTVLVRYQEHDEQIKTDSNGEIYLTHAQATSAQIILDYKSPKKEIKHKDVHGE